MSNWAIKIHEANCAVSVRWTPMQCLVHNWFRYINFFEQQTHDARRTPLVMGLLLGETTLKWPCTLTYTMDATFVISEDDFLSSRKQVRSIFSQVRYLSQETWACGDSWQKDLQTLLLLVLLTLILRIAFCHSSGSIGHTVTNVWVWYQKTQFWQKWL